MPIDNLIIMTRLFLFPKGTLISSERAWIEAEDIYLRIYSSKPQHRGYRARRRLQLVKSWLVRAWRQPYETYQVRFLREIFEHDTVQSGKSQHIDISIQKTLSKKVRKRSFALPFHNKMPSFMLIISRMLKITRQRYPEYYRLPTIWCGTWKGEICPLIRQLTAL